MAEERPPQGSAEPVKPPRMPARYTVLGPESLDAEVVEGGEPLTIDVRS